MIAAFDAVMLSVYLHPTAKPPKPVKNLPGRIQMLVDELEADGSKILIATPVLSEFMVLVGPHAASQYLSEFNTSDVFEVKGFDTIAAIEAAEMHRKAMNAGDKKAGSTARWQVVKVDRQFVAIAKVNGVEVIYSDDEDVRKMAESVGIKCKGIEDLPTPPVEEHQDKLAGLDDAEPTPALPSNVIPLPSSQSPGDGQASDSQPVPGPLGGRRAFLEPQQPDSSPLPSPERPIEPPKG